MRSLTGFLALIVEEAVRVFELNVGLFSVLRPPTAAGAKSEVTSVDTALISDTADKVPKAERTYSVSSVLAVLLAASLTHFILVVGGFTGARGYAKLEAAQEWFFNDFLSSFKN